MNGTIHHEAVMPAELDKYLNVHNKKDGIFVDCTGGGGGHAEIVLRSITPKSRLLIIDRDAEAIARLQEKFKYNDNVTVFKANFKDIDIVLDKLGICKVDGLYADFGMSSYQLYNDRRGFSFRKDGPLDMRMDAEGSLTAYDVVNGFSQEAIAKIIMKYGEDRFANRIADFIVKSRSVNKIDSTVKLANIIKEAIPKRHQKNQIHPATKTFQAIRIFINKELEAIEFLLQKIDKITSIGGRVVFISFHSLEDRLVKEMLNYYAKNCICPVEYPVCICNKQKTFTILTKKPITASPPEIQRNPLSRSAKLRAAERV